MATFTNPAEIARETLKLLLARRMPPTPDNYRAIYNEIAELGDADAPTPEREFKACSSRYRRRRPPSKASRASSKAPCAARTGRTTARR